MNKLVEINYDQISKNENYEFIIKNVLKKCFEEEKINMLNFYINVVLTNSLKIKEINKEFRNFDKETDVLSFPMFEKSEIEEMLFEPNNEVEYILGDIVISIEKVVQQAEEYGHSFERELSYMIVHGFYHLMGYDHIEDGQKIVMRQKEENVLLKLNIIR